MSRFVLEHKWTSVAIALVLVLAIGVTVRWWTADPWERLSAVAASFPAPDGFERAAESRTGERPAVCDVQFDCEEAQLRVVYEGASADPCAALRTSVDEWRQRGFEFESSTEARDSPCAFYGTMRGHYVQVAVERRGGEPFVALSIGS
jgi:hypothetical protein